MASSDPKDQDRVRVEMRRLNQFQILLGCGAALAYLAGNDAFIRLWWLHKQNLTSPAPLPLQMAFALNLAVTASGDAGLQLALRSGKNGLRWVGTMVALTGTLNLGLSILAMTMGSLRGIAMATVLAQSLSVLGASFYICRHLRVPWLPWALKGCVLPLAGISLAGWLRMRLPMDSVSHVFLLVGCYAAMLFAAAWGLGVNLALIKDEVKMIKTMLGK
jgi:hypothetical protein